MSDSRTATAKPVQPKYLNEHHLVLATVGHAGVWVGVLLAFVGTYLVAVRGSIETGIEAEGATWLQIIGAVVFVLGAISLIGLQVARAVSYDIQYRFGQTRLYRDGERDDRL